MNRVLAIAGGSGSGKSTLAATLVAALARIAVLLIDAYYHDLSLDVDVQRLSISTILTLSIWHRLPIMSPV